MKPEIEVKFLDVNHDEFRKKLAVSGATLIHKMRHMRRAVLDYPDRRLQRGVNNKFSWVRVRDEGDKVTCTYKQIISDGRDSTHEIEIEISSYEEAIAIFLAIGLEVHTVQETRRETWRLGEVEILLDEWPWLPPFIEIEGPDEKAIRSIAEKLGFDWQSAFIGNGDRVYRKYFQKITEQESISEMPELSFKKMPDWLKERR